MPAAGREVLVIQSEERDLFRMVDELKLFEQDLGSWDAEIEVNLPNGVEKSKGKMTSWLVGGRWLVVDFKNETGFEGHGVYGYDSDQKRYVGTWVDSMRGFLARGVGSWDPETRKMTYTYEHTAGGRQMAWREETTKNPDGSQTFQVIMKGPAGADQVMMKVAYRKE
jgi:Protein of unknown function (DUF1579)